MGERMLIYFKQKTKQEKKRLLFCIAIVLILITGFVLTKRYISKYKTMQTSAVQDISFNDVLATTSTPLINNKPNRRANIILACEKINGTILMPNDTFSFNQIVGIRTEAKGFKPAPCFMDGKICDSIGGGVCQVSSTLYYACLLSDFNIISRKNHSMSPDYLEMVGIDCTVSCDEDIDYKFENNTNNPIKIFVWVEEARVYVKIVGTKLNNNTIFIENEILSTIPYETIYRDNLNLVAGEEKVIQPGFTGYLVKTYRVTKDENGNIISRKLEAKSDYKKLDAIIEHSY